ncbi:MAG: tetratricopeptide repeat protein, partial [Desulfomonile sp.]|nr:tetratricopeptide repeat protein [Desulfomonile sp.]
SLDLVAQITRAQGDRAEAAQIYNRSLAIQEKVLGPSHPRVIKTMCALADLNAEQDRLFEARALYQKARVAAEATNRAEDLDMVAPLVGLAKLDQASGNYMECRELCRQILAICPKYVKYQSGLADLIAGTLRQLHEVSALHEERVRQ